MSRPSSQPGPTFVAGQKPQAPLGNTADRRIVFYSPTYDPVGGVVKIFDYVNHALAADMHVEFACPKPFPHEGPIQDIPHIADALNTIKIHRSLDVPIGQDDLAFFSWPTHYRDIAECLPAGYSHDQLIHIVQNVRHANPHWIKGYATRLLGRPLSRIMITDEVEAACRPWVNPNSITETIIEGHAADYFSKARFGQFNNPIRVGYTTWKSEVGLEVEQLLADDDRFVFQSIQTTAGWSDIRSLYHWSDIFLGCPGPEEGFYLVGLEAMAAGAILLMSDAGGNRAYAQWGKNCLQVRHDSASDYVDKIDDLATSHPEIVNDLRLSGYQTPAAFTLDREAAQFRQMVANICDPNHCRSTAPSLDHDLTLAQSTYGEQIVPPSAAAALPAGLGRT